MSEDKSNGGGVLINGIMNIYKEAGYTSHDVVAKLRGIVKQKKLAIQAHWIRMPWAFCQCALGVLRNYVIY